MQQRGEATTYDVNAASERVCHQIWVGELFGIDAERFGDLAEFDVWAQCRLVFTGVLGLAFGKYFECRLFDGAPA